MKRFLNNTYRTVFVMLGSACNLQCKYCIQHNIVNDLLKNEMNYDVIHFIREIAKSQKEKLRILFYGGEPLIYLKNIKEIIEELKCENVYFSLISNGKLLTGELVEYLNTHNVQVAISWDGRGSGETRGFDVVKEKEEMLLSLNSLCFSGVLSAQNYIADYIQDIEGFDRKYFSKHNYHVNFNMDEIMDLGMEESGLSNIDTERMRKETEYICREYARFFYAGGSISPIKEQFVISMVSRLQGLREKNISSFAVCGNGYDVLNVDLQGNLYRCHNTDDKIGTIYNTYWKCLDGVIKYDCTKENFRVCERCEVYDLCNGGCPLVPENIRDKYYCSLKRAVFYPVMQLVEDLLRGGCVNAIHD